MRTLGDKRGVMFFTVDALIAGIVFTLTVVLILSFIMNTPVSVDAKYYTNSYVDYISNTKMSQFNGNYKFIYHDPYEPNPGVAVYEKILLMKSKGVGNYTDFVNNFTLVVIPEHVGIKYEIDGLTIYERHSDRIEKADILISTSLLTFVVDENMAIYGPNITRITIWV